MFHKSIGWLAASLLLFACPTAASIRAAAPTSKLFLIGGGWEDGDGEDGGIFRAMCDNAPRKARNARGADRIVENGQQVLLRVAIVTAASSEPNAPEAFKALFEGKSNSHYRIKAEWVPITINSKENAKDPSVIQILDRSNILFFTGGDQSVLLRSFTDIDPETNALVDSPFLARLKRMFSNDEILVSGTSAGTAVQAAKRATMITGGESWQSLVHGAFKEDSTSIPYALTHNPLGGFGLFTLGLIDTHFSERGRQGRIVRLAAHSRSSLAFGVDENSAIFVKSSTSGAIETATLRIFGGVHVFNITEGLRSGVSLRRWQMLNVYNSYLTAGDQLSIVADHSTSTSSAQVAFAHWKSSLWGRQEPRTPKGSNDIFSSPDDDDDELSRKFPRAFTNVALDLVGSELGNETLSTSYEHHPTYTVRMKRIDSGSHKTAVMQGEEPGTNRSYISYDGVYVDFFSLDPQGADDLE